jgi:D-alanine-D-alanine ligase
MRVVLLHDAVKGAARPDERDVLEQVRVVSEALEEAGHDALPLALDLDLERAGQTLVRLEPDLVFNLVESVGGQGRLIHLAPALLDTLGIPYTGSCTEAIFQTSDKRITKRMLACAGLPSPPWVFLSEEGLSTEPTRGGYIIKPAWEDASLGLDDACVVDAAQGDLAAQLEARAERIGGPVFAEVYVEGREFNFSLLAKGRDVEPLPPAEILFESYPPGKPRIVGYAAKWEPASFEYSHTTRRFDFPPQDRELLAQLRELALACWKLFDLAGYARVDFRVDERARPWILEVNPNPCLSPDAGFLAAGARVSLGVAQVVQRIVEAAGVRPAV